jgi:hypothetical protein
MPRLSKKQYLKYHKTLRHLWLNHQSVYSYLSPTKQWQLHDFFQPSKELTNERLLEHRKVISKERPSLPHQAGWALKDINQVLGTFAKQPVRAKGRHNASRVTVRPIVRPEIDGDKLALAFWLMAKRMAKDQASRYRDHDDPSEARRNDE